ncbi:MAG TPA: prolyl oligopeptidase family serine peptidase [Actinomycetes bacterium]
MTSPGSFDESFPRRAARTGRFTFGAPRLFQPSADGARVAFLRSGSGTERSTSLWVLDVATASERLVVDPAELLAGGDERLPAQERSRRERMREGGAGVTSYTTDREGRLAAFALSSRLFVADLTGPYGAVELPAAGPVIDPRLSPDGTQVAYVADGGLHVVAVPTAAGTGAGTSASRVLAQPDGPHVTYGLADFAAAEELERHRGYWWAPDSSALLVARVDDEPVQVWHIGDPENPSQPATEHRYPAAGTPNADVTLWLLGLDGARIEVTWDREAYPYLVTVHWSAAGRPLLQVLSRRQESAPVLTVDLTTGATLLLRELTDPVWVDVVPGTPAWTSSGELLTVEVVEDRYALHVDGHPVSPAGVHVRAVSDVSSTDGTVLVVGSEGIEQHVYRLGAPGAGGARPWLQLSEPGGVNAARAAGDLLVLLTATLVSPATRATVSRAGELVAVVATHVADPGFVPGVRFPETGSGLPTAVLLPSGWAAGDPALPVLMDPYGGPHHGLVTASARGFLEAQWWADQGFCVVVADGRGTPGTPSWERTVRLDLTDPPLADQVAALQAVAGALPGVLDLERVAIRGWSFGGYLAALAVLRRPDVFHAAVAGAPVTDWTLYDTAYTERYLGLPDEHPEAYAAGSLVGLAPSLSRPLMIIHGLADDNVVAAHSLRLSSALLAAGRPHTLLPLSGVTHMTPQEVVAENLLLLQLDFLRRSLGLVSDLSVSDQVPT